MSRTEPDFMQRCYDCRRIIWFYEKENPNVCKSCFKYPKPVVVVQTYNYELGEAPPAYNWLTTNEST